MTLSGSTGTTNFASYNSFGVYITWSGSKNNAGNYTDVTATMHLKSNNGSSYLSDASCSGSININGNNQGWSGRVSIGPGGNQGIFSKTVRVGHNSDGTKNFGISGSFTISVPAFGTGNIGTHTWDLDSIPREGTMSVPSGLEFGKTSTFNITSYSSSFYYFIEFRVNNNLLGVILNGGRGGNNNVTIPRDYASSLPNSSSSVCGFRLITSTSSSGWGNGALVGYRDYSATVTVPSSMGPSIGSLTYADTVSSVSNVTGSNQILVDALSSVRLSSSASAQYGASIRSYDFTVGSYRVNNGDSSSLTLDLNRTKIGTGTVATTLTVTDSRGMTASRSMNLTVRPYSLPKITNANIARLTNPATTVRIIKPVTVSSVANGSGSNVNTYTVTTKWRKFGTSSWTTVFTENNVSNQKDIPGLEIVSSYEIEVTLADRFASDVVRVIIPTGYVLLDFYKDVGIGIGKFHSQGVLDIYGSVYHDGGDIYHGGNKIQMLEVTASNGNALVVDDRNWDKEMNTGFYMINEGANKPAGSGGWNYLHVTKHNGNYILQEAVDFWANTSAFRTKTSGTWGAWKYYAIQNNAVEFTTVKQTKVFTATLAGPYGLEAKATRCGNIVNFSIDTIYRNAHQVTGKAAETIPVGWRPTTSQSITLTGHAGGGTGTQNWADSFADLKYNTDGTINYTIITKAQPLGMMGSITWVTTDPFPAS